MEFDAINNLHNSEFTNRLLQNKQIFYEIYEACNSTFWKGCGSYLFDGQEYKYCNVMYEKQELLYSLVKSATHVLEIGTYMGHSLLIMLLSNPNLKITCIDIDDTYTRHAVDVLNKYFNNAITFIHGDSIKTLKQMTIKFDFFHIDGHHENNYITEEFKLILQLNMIPTHIRVVFDDQDCLRTLQDDLKKNYIVGTSIIPQCKWNNAYYELKLV